jgi:hypothetical protein
MTDPEDKTKDLLAVLDLPEESQTPEEIQFQWSPLKAWVSKNVLKEPDERIAFQKGYISLADLAFRLRDEAVIKYGDKGQTPWTLATAIVWGHCTGPARDVSFGDWWLNEARPIHYIIAYIIAALIAKEKT